MKPTHAKALAGVTLLATLVSAQPKSALEFYDTTGTNPTARFGWTDADGGKFFLQAPVGTNVLTTQGDDMTVAGEVTATQFNGDGSALTGVSKPGHSHTVDSNSIANGGIMDRNINNRATISGFKINPDFGPRNIVTEGQIQLAGTENAPYVLGAAGEWAGPSITLDLLALTHGSDTILCIEEIPVEPYYGINGRGAWTLSSLHARSIVADTLQVRHVYTTPSDHRLKHNITSLDSCISRVKNIEGVAFDFDPETAPDLRLPEDHQVGLIAQEVEQVLPEAVRTGSDGYKRVDYTKLVPVLVNAIKEQQHVIEQQAKSIDQQSRDIEKLKSYIGIE